ESTRNLGRAVTLDPRSVKALWGLASNYWGLRRYAEERSAVDRILAIVPDDPVYKTERALVEFRSEANTRPLHQAIDSIRATNPAALPSIATQWLICSLAERDATAARNALIALGDTPMYWTGGGVNFNRPFMEGVIARMVGDEVKARAAFAAA